MASPDWRAFLAGVLLLTAALMVLSWVSARAFDAALTEAAAEPSPGTARRPLPTGAALVANVALTHGVLVLVLAGLVWRTSTPVGSLGVAPVSASQVLAGVGVGTALYLASEAAAGVADRFGVAYDERLRESLAPDGPREWAVLLLVGLPLVAVAEELLFRGVLVGALAAGFDLPVWGLAVGSSLVFGLGHGAQGPVGVVLATALGLALAAGFVLTGSLLTVVVAHYTVDVLEFVVREGLVD